MQSHWTIHRSLRAIFQTLSNSLWTLNLVHVHVLRHELSLSDISPYIAIVHASLHGTYTCMLVSPFSTLYHTLKSELKSELLNCIELTILTHAHGSVHLLWCMTSHYMYVQSIGEVHVHMPQTAPTQHVSAYTSLTFDHNTLALHLL